MIAIGLSAAHALGQFHPDLDRSLPGTVQSDQPAQSADAKIAATLRELTHIALTGNEREQIGALEKIFEIGDDAAMSAAKIRPLLDAPSVDVSRAAAEALAAMGPAACPQWLDAAKSPDGFTRMLALEALSNRQLKIKKINLGDLRAVLDANLKDVSRQVRIPAAKALLRFWPASAPEIMEAIKHHDGDVREVMLEGLWYERNGLPRRNAAAGHCPGLPAGEGAPRPAGAARTWPRVRAGVAGPARLE
ncbi:MAG TPA: hypothetical protein VFE47_08640 [Tepidisphaeraceae bacterium]|nr:hypothetical protein [Tepidisphaeraceae bacterium]